MRWVGSPANSKTDLFIGAIVEIETSNSNVQSRIDGHYGILNLSYLTFRTGLAPWMTLARPKGM